MFSVFNSQSNAKNKFIDKLFKDYSQMMYNVAFGILHKETDAEDAVHEAFIRIITHLPKIMQISRNEIAFYLVIIVKNIAYDMLRESKHIASTDIDTLNISSDEDIECLTIEKLTCEEIAAELRKLPENDYEILYMYIILQFRPNEIADMLNITPDTVRQRIYRAKQKLKRIWRNRDE